MEENKFHVLYFRVSTRGQGINTSDWIPSVPSGSN